VIVEDTLAHHLCRLYETKLVVISEVNWIRIGFRMRLDRQSKWGAPGLRPEVFAMVVTLAFLIAEEALMVAFSDSSSRVLFWSWPLGKNRQASGSGE
jgi:hypothetical protein